jgi:mono/diheme cytochrome c family protein
MRPTSPIVLAALLATLGVGRATEGVDFERQIKPLLEKSCVQCHGPEKQKGKLRLDTREGLLKGGDAGEAIAKGKPDESEFFRRVIAAPDDEEVMPPKGKADHLTAAEIDLVKRWITEGAPWPEGVVAVSLESAKAAPVGPPPQPLELEARRELPKYGARLRSVASKVNWVRVNFRSMTGEIPPGAWSHVRALANLVEADFGGVQIHDEQLANLSGLSNLTVLNLSRTPITDAGLDHILRLEKLTTLNLYATAITDAGLSKIASLKALKQLFLAETKVTPEGIAALKAALPDLQVEDGWQFIEVAKQTSPVKPVKAPAPPATPAPAPVAIEETKTLAPVK